MINIRDPMFFLIMLPATFGVIIITMFVFLDLNGTTITIEREYYDEYAACQEEQKVLMGDFEEMVESKSIQCPDVECRTGPTGTVLIIFGFLIYIFSLYYNHQSRKKLDEREEALKEREAALLLEKKSRRKK